MPVYEYECSACHFHFERKQRFDEKPVAICPKCQGKARRVLHSVPIFFRGSGFYSTDYGSGWQGTDSGKKGKPAEKEGEDSSPRDKSQEGKTSK